MENDLALTLPEAEKGFIGHNSFGDKDLNPFVKRKYIKDSITYVIEIEKIFDA